MASNRLTSPRAKARPEPSREALAAALADHERELAEAREFQGATSEVLNVIGRSPGDARPVFDMILRHARKLCDADRATVHILRDGAYHLAAVDGHRRTEHDLGLLSAPISPGRGSITGRVALERRVVQIPDVQADPEFAYRRDAGFEFRRAMLGVPLLREGEVAGVIVLQRPVVKPFSERQINLVATFADQAMIAIENARLFKETKEALEREAAASEVLRVVSESPTDARPVFEAIVLTAARLLGCGLVAVLLRDGNSIASVVAATAGGLQTPRTRRWPIDPTANFPSRVIISKERLYLPDWSCIDLPEFEREIRDVLGVRSSLLLPMLRQNECFGVLALIGERPNMFGPTEIALAESFRDQAMIAIENARLFNETREALERQTATAEILKVIASSPADTRPVFDAIATSANRLLGGLSTAVWRFDGDKGYLEAFTPTSPAADAALKALSPLLLADFVVFAMVRDGRTAQIPETEDGPTFIRDLARLRGYRGMLFVPLMSQGAPIGLVSVTREKPGAFNPDDVQLLQTFADQAVIAIQNARALNETREALEQQKASADVLGVIGKSVADTGPVFEAIIDACQRLFGSEEIGVYTVGDDDMVRVAAWRGPRAEEVRNDVTPLSESVTGRIIKEGRVHHIPDLLTEPNLSPTIRERAARLGSASLLYAPMLWEDGGVGSILVVRSPPKPFSEREKALLQTFADQAAIAIQNARLFDAVQARTRDLTEALQTQTATSEVLKVISRSAFDLQTVLDTLAKSAAGLGGADFSVIYFSRGDVVRAEATFGCSPEFIDFMARTPQKPGRGTTAGRVFLSGEVVTIPDVAEDPDYRFGAAPQMGNYRALLVVPMFREHKVEGAFVLGRARPGPFSRRQIELTQTFADQAVIAIQNARLFNETQEALRQQTATAEVLKVISRSAFDLQTVLETLINSAVELCAANRGAIFLRDGEVFRWRAASRSASEYIEFMRAHPRIAGRRSMVARVIQSGRIECIPDVLEDDEFELPLNELTRSRAILGAPLLRDGKVEGVLVLSRFEPGPFTQRQIDLVQTFADQAIIAIENVRLFDEVQARTRDLSESLQQQTATADVLKVISRSAFDLQAVFETLNSSAVTLCGAFACTIFLRDGDALRYRATSAASPALQEYFNAHPSTAGRGTIVGRLMLSGRVECVPDVLEDKEYVVPAFGFNPTGSLLGVPLLRDGKVEGALVLARGEPGLFTPRQIELVQTFADQAMIAIENVRLFDEVQARTGDLTEALEQQTATADVLKAISRTAFDLDTVLETLISTATRLCNAKHGQIFRRHGDVYRYAASRMDVDPAYVEHEQRVEIKPGRGTLVGRVALENRAVSVADAWSDPEYEEKGAARVGNVRAMLGVPLMRGGEPIGAFALARTEPIPFTERQIELVTTFADQAVIAIENVRLFDEVQARTRDLEEALQQQTATADVLKVISRSAFDLHAVLDTLVTSAARLCEAEKACIFQRRGDLYHWVSNFGFSDELVAHARSHPFAEGGGSTTSRVARDRRTIHVPDVLADPDYTASEYQRLGVYRTILGVPLLREGAPIGVFIMTREAVRPFNDRQIELLQTFADQAVIAIENVRLFDEVQARTRDLVEALQQQTATADVLKVISRSAFDVQVVLDTLLQSAARLVGTDSGNIYLRAGDHFAVKAFAGDVDPAFIARLKERSQVPDRSTVGGRVLLTGEVHNIPDIRRDPEYDSHLKETSDLRAVLGVPMKRGDEMLGAFALASRAPGAFSQRQIELVQTFADQAVIAIENARLFDEVQARTRDLTEALQQQTATADVLKVISRSAFDLQAVFDTLTASAVELSGAFSGTLCVRDGDVYRFRGNAGAGVSPALTGYLEEHPPAPSRGSITGRVLLSGKVEAIADIHEDPEYVLPISAHGQTSRALLGVPLLAKDRIEGALVLTSREPGLFTSRQIDLVQTFADQAVIAIENVRLFDEVQARTRDLSEALQQQTATADVLKVISRSAFDLQAVFDTLVRSAAALCDSTVCVIYLRSGDEFHARAFTDTTEDFVQYLRAHPQTAGRGSVGARILLTGEMQCVADVRLDEEYELAVRANMNSRALLGIPLKRDSTLVGAMVLGQPRPGPFSQRHIDLIQTFADQAVIAIENVRLFDEVQARTRDLSEALQLQIATSDVLKVISRSAFDLQAVFDALITSAVELCGAYSGSICVRDGDVFRYTGSAGPGSTPEMHAYLEKHPATPGRATMVGRVLLSGKVEHILDRLEDQDYTVPTAIHGNPSRAFLGVPLLGKGGIEGALVLTRLEPGEFTDRQIEIVRTFTDQAVIAIENVRLFEQVQARTRELSASLDDLRKAQDRLVQSEKLASLGQLTAGIAHEIKNPLNFVNNFSMLSRELLGELRETLEKAPLDDGQRDETEDLLGLLDSNLDKVVSHGKRADSIVKNMLLHSREGSGERATTNVNAMVEEALNLAYHGARAEKAGFNVTIEKSLDPNAGVADIYPQELTRVLLNLISNGFYATNKRKQAGSIAAYEPTLAASTRDLGDRVEIAIRDNGTGIPEEVRAKMFNPFFTTKPAGEGTGLGLSLSHDIVVKQHGGTLEVESEIGAFTRFTIALPRAARGM